LEIKELFREWLETHAPERAQRVMALVRGMRGGKDYDAAWGQRLTGAGPYAKLLGARFRKAAARLGLDRPSFDLDTTQFRPRPRAGESLHLF
jgi:DNA repair photolyase